MEQNLFNEISLIIVVAAVMALIMRIIKQPFIIGHILTGILVGPSLLGLTHSKDVLEIFSTIGVALLLFIIGLGLSLKVIKEIGRVAAIVGTSTIVVTTALGYSLGTIMNLTKTESVAMGIAMSFSSTIIVLKLLSDKKEQNKLHGKIITGVLIVEDVIAAFALMAIAARGSGAAFDPATLLILIVKGLSLTIPLLLFGSYVLPRFSKLFAGSQEFLFLFSIGWGLGMASLFKMAGFSLEIGALIAGISLASLPYTQEIASRLQPLRDFFIVVFFISLGSHLTLSNLGEYVVIILILFIVISFIKPLLMLVTLGALGYTKKISFKTAIALTQISEFSLIFLTIGYKEGLISNELVTVMTLTTLVTIAYSTYTITYSDAIFEKIKSHLDLFERRHPNRESEHHTNYDLVLFGYQKGGREFVHVFKSLKKKFIVVDYDPDVIDILERRKIDYLYGDATDLDLLSEAGIEKSKLIVSTITDHQTNIFLIKHLEKINPQAVVLCHADSVQEAGELYEMGVSYVMMPHYIGSEKIGSFIKKSGLKKSEFSKYRDRHLNYLQTHFTAAID